MTTLRETLGDYLRIRRGLGFELREEGRLLEGFVEFMERAGAEWITTKLALAWATSTPAHPHWHRRRLGLVRGFARYVASLDPATEVPSKDLLPAHRPRVTPYIYSPAEIRALIAAAGRLTPALRAAPPDADRAAGVNRPAARGSARARPPGRRPQARCAPRPGRQAPQAARGAAAPHDHHGAAQLCPGARPALPRTGNAGVLHRRARAPGASRGTEPDLHAADPRGRTRGPRRPQATAPA